MHDVLSIAGTLEVTETQHDNSKGYMWYDIHFLFLPCQRHVSFRFLLRNFLSCSLDSAKYNYSTINKKTYA